MEELLHNRCRFVQREKSLVFAGKIKARELSGRTGKAELLVGRLALSLDWVIYVALTCICFVFQLVNNCRYIFANYLRRSMGKNPLNCTQVLFTL